MPPTPPLLTRWNFILGGSVIDSSGYEEARSNLSTPDGLLSLASPKRRSREAPRGGESQDFLLPFLYTVSIGGGGDAVARMSVKYLGVSRLVISRKSVRR